MRTWPTATIAAERIPKSAARLRLCTSKKIAAYTGRRASTTPRAEASATAHPSIRGRKSESINSRSRVRLYTDNVVALRVGYEKENIFREGTVVDTSREWVVALFGRRVDRRAQRTMGAIHLTEVLVLR